LPLELRPIEQAPWLGVPLAVQLVGNHVQPGVTFRLTGHRTPLYEKPDGWSKIIVRLPKGTVVTFNGVEANFIRVVTSGGGGYIPRGTLAQRLEGNANQSPPPNPDIVDHRPDVESQPMEQFSEDHDPAFIPLYERPDGWSRVLAHLPHDAVLTSAVQEGNFIRVTAADNTVGYIARSAGLAALKALQR